jgi:biopolymer transport protein ExbD
MRRHKKQKPKIVFPISAMIDCTFLLLIYFMAACTLHKQEADISFSLPGQAEISEPLAMPDEQIVEIRADGGIVLNDREIDSPQNKDLPQLTETLTRFRQVCESAKNEAMLVIHAADDAAHQRVVEVLNACAAANVNNVTFSFDDEEEYF